MSSMVNAAICLVALIYVDIQEEWFPKYQLPLPRLIDRWRWELTIAVEIARSKSGKLKVTKESFREALWDICENLRLGYAC